MCGACCAFYRVAFQHANHIDIPIKLIVEIPDSTEVAMRGTLKKDPRCAALNGKIGEQVSCSIYENRPYCCQAFSASYEDGQKNRRCDAAREAYGLPILTPDVWSFYELALQQNSKHNALSTQI
jgi:Fe-S-cluster containining protein